MVALYSNTPGASNIISSSQSFILHSCFGHFRLVVFGRKIISCDVYVGHAGWSISNLLDWLMNTSLIEVFGIKDCSEYLR